METNDDILNMLRDSVASFLDTRQTAPVKGTVPGAARSLDRSLWREMASLGWLGLRLPEQLGGMGLGLREATVLTGLFGQEAFAAPYVAAALMPAVILAHSEASEHVSELAAGLASGDMLLTVAWQERPADIESLSPATHMSSVDFRVSGKKCFVPACESDSILLVTVDTGNELAIVAIDAAAAGVSRKPYATGLGSMTDIHFDSAPILFGQPLLQGAAAEQALRTCLETGQVAVSAQLAGLARGCLNKTLRYVSDRVQFGRPIGSFQAIRHRCVDLHIESVLAEASWRHALGAGDTAASPKQVAAIGAAKARCGDTALSVARASVQMYGAMGFTEEGGIGRYLRAALAGSAWLGSATAHRRRFLTVQGDLEHA